MTMLEAQVLRLDWSLIYVIFLMSFAIIER